MGEHESKIYAILTLLEQLEGDGRVVINHNSFLVIYRAILEEWIDKRFVQIYSSSTAFTIYKLNV